MLEECRLIELNLSDNVIGPDGARRIAQAMDLNVSINSLKYVYPFWSKSGPKLFC